MQTTAREFSSLLLLLLQALEMPWYNLFKFLQVKLYYFLPYAACFAPTWGSNSGGLGGVSQEFSVVRCGSLIRLGGMGCPSQLEANREKDQQQGGAPR